MSVSRERDNRAEEESGNGPKTTSSFNMLSSQKGRLWADIFAPKSIKQLIGNSVNIKAFKEWMMSWNSETRKRLMRERDSKKKRRPKVKDGRRRVVTASEPQV